MTQLRSRPSLPCSGPAGRPPLHGLSASPPAQLSEGPARRGRVTLVGAGPGAEELLTLKAARALTHAQVVLYDHLVSEDILSLLPPDCERFYVGKQASRHSVPQPEIIAWLIQLADGGQDVVRLKGGDPYIFGRGGEEAQALVAAGLEVDVVPGISAAQGASALAGIPLTHRDCADAVTYITGHARADGVERSAAEWAALARPRQTLVVYMGLTRLRAICQALAASCLGADCPAALVASASLPTQQVLTGTLATLADRVEAAQVVSPALLIIGEVVRLHAQIGAARPEGAAARPAN